ncbi:ATP-binding protein [Streptomyces sp. NPDC006997]|uniref:ATP-binding protein n=1 Tax=Streptomyces sp. NPDC006997 TaxID=3155356 RepID=UPI0033F4B547
MGSSSLGAHPGAGPAGTPSERRFRFELAAHPGSPAQARRLTRARLTGWSVCEDTCDTAALVVSELVTNAIVHTASTTVVCELRDCDDLVRIAVRDEGCAPGEPHPSPSRPEEEHGRGLLLVDAVCRAWGALEHGPGLLVWAELPRGAYTDEPSNDLGWGARPKPGGSGGSDEEDDTDPAPQGGTGAHPSPHGGTGVSPEPRPSIPGGDAPGPSAHGTPSPRPPAHHRSDRGDRVDYRGDRLDHRPDRPEHRADRAEHRIDHRTDHHPLPHHRPEPHSPSHQHPAERHRP